MSNYQTGSDLVNAILNVCGELTDGTSGYQTDALTYLNLAYKGLQTGGNIYGVDVADPWPWAIARRPIVVTLQPQITAVAVTTVQGSFTVTLSVAPTDQTGANISLTDWWVNINNRDEWFQVTSHVAGTLTATIDVPYTESSVTAAYAKFVKLDYDLVSDSVIVTSQDNKIDFAEGPGIAMTATLTAGIYTPAAYAALVNAAFVTAGGALTYTGAWNQVTRLFTWTASGVFSILNASGPNASISASPSMGLDCLDYTGSASYSASYPLNAVCRLTSPMLCYRKANTPWRSPKNEGKIYELSFNTFVREYPLTMLCSGTPDKFCVVKTSKTGIVTVRFNGYFTDLPTKVEVGFIQKYRLLQANVASVPIVPEEHRKYLVDAAAAMLMHDKSDAKRTEREGLAKAGLQALQNSSRKELSLAGINYGKLIPRQGQTQRRWGWQST